MKDCGIVKDLLPLYAEKLASEESAAFVKEHLETCEDCRKAYEEMKAPVETDAAAPLVAVRKTVKKRGLLIAGTIACLVAALLLGAFARLKKPISIHSTEEAFAETEVVPETIPLPAPQAEKAAEPETPEPQGQPGEDNKTDPETELVKEVQQSIIVMQNDKQNVEIRYVVLEDGVFHAVDEIPPEDQPISQIGVVIRVQDQPLDESASKETYAYVYSIPNSEDAAGEKLEPDAVIAPTPKTLKLTAENGTRLTVERNGNEISVGAYTTLWDKWFSKDEKQQEVEIALSDVDAVFFEPYGNTDRIALYQREGYAPEAGYALPRLVMNYYMLIALAGTAILAVVWLILLLTKKQKARRVFGVLLLIAGSFALAFLFAGFPATTIAPMRELLFVCLIALLLIGSGLCGRKLLRKE